MDPLMLKLVIAGDSKVQKATLLYEYSFNDLVTTEEYLMAIRR